MARAKRTTRIEDVDKARRMAFVEDEAREFPDLSWLKFGEGSYFCRPCREQFRSPGAKMTHDDRRHPDKAARRTVLTAAGAR